MKWNEVAAQELERAATELRDFTKRGTYTIGEARAIRSRILNVVREEIDPHACGHMPEERRY